MLEILEMLATIIGATVIGIYLAGILVLIVGFLSENQPLSYARYLPLIPVWPVVAFIRIRGALLNSR